MTIALRHNIATASPGGVVEQRTRWDGQAGEQGRPLTTMEATAQTKKEEPIVFGSSF